MNKAIYWTVGFIAGTLTARIAIKEVRIANHKIALKDEQRRTVEDLVRPL